MAVSPGEALQALHTTSSTAEKQSIFRDWHHQTRTMLLWDTKTQRALSLTKDYFMYSVFLLCFCCFFPIHCLSSCKGQLTETLTAQIKLNLLSHCFILFLPLLCCHVYLPLHLCWQGLQTNMLKLLCLLQFHDSKMVASCSQTYCDGPGKVRSSAICGGDPRPGLTLGRNAVRCHPAQLCLWSICVCVIFKST